MINSKRKSGAVFSFRFSEILSSTANVSDHHSDQPDDEDIVIVAEEKEKSFFGKTGRKLGMKESAKSKVDVKEKSEKKGKSKGVGKKRKDGGKGKASSGSEESGSDKTMVAEMETKEETIHKVELSEKSRKGGKTRRDKDSVQHREDNVDVTSEVSDTREETTGKGNGMPDNDGVASEDVSHVPDGDAVGGEDQVFNEASEGHNTTEIRKEGSKRRGSSRQRKSTSRAKNEEKVRKKSIKENSRTDRKSSYVKKSSGVEKTGAATKGTSDEDKDHIATIDAAEQSTSEFRKGGTVTRRSSRLKSVSKADMEKSGESRVKEDSRIERDSSVSQSLSEVGNTAAAEVNLEEDEIFIGDTKVLGTSVIEKDGGRKRKNSKPLKLTSKVKMGKKDEGSGVDEDPKMKKKGSKIPSKVGEVSVPKEKSDENEDDVMMGDSKDGTSKVEKETDGSASEMFAEIDEKKTTGRKKSASTARKGRRNSKKEDFKLTSQEDEDETGVRENAATNVTRQRKSKRIRSKAESLNERDKSHSDKESQNLQRTDAETVKDERGKEKGGSAENDGSSSSEKPETRKEQRSSSSQSEGDCLESVGDKKMTKKSQLKEQKNKTSKAGKRKNLSLEEHLENDKNRQLEETKSKRTRRTKSLASYSHDNKGDGETKADKETDDESKKEEAAIANGEGVQEDDPSKVGGEKSQGDRNNTIVDLQLKGSSRKRKSTSLHSTKTKVKRGDKSKEERINTVKKTLDYGEQEDSDWEEVVDGDGEAVANDGTVEGDGVPESEKTNLNKVSPSKEKEEDSEEREDEKNDSSDHQPAGEVIL